MDFMNQAGAGQFFNAGAQQYRPMNATLSSEEIAMLQEQAPKEEFFTAASNIDLLRCACSHKYQNGTGALVPTGDGRFRCSICGKTFRPVELDTDISPVIDAVKDVAESIKFYFGNINPQQAKNIYSALWILDQLPGMWKVASDYARSVASVNNFAPQGYDGRTSASAIYKAIINDPVGYQQYAQQHPYMQGGMPQAGMGQMPPMGQPGPMPQGMPPMPQAMPQMAPQGPMPMAPQGGMPQMQQCQCPPPYMPQGGMPTPPGVNMAQGQQAGYQPMSVPPYQTQNPIGNVAVPQPQQASATVDVASPDETTPKA